MGREKTRRRKVGRRRLELVDLDCVTAKEDVEDALERNLEEIIGDTKILKTKSNRREQNLAIVQINKQSAKKLFVIYQ